MVTGAAAVTVDTSRAAGPGLGGPVLVRTTGPSAADRSPATARPGRTVRSWPLLVLAAPAAAEVRVGRHRAEDRNRAGLPLPGIWPSLHLDTAVTLPVSRPTPHTRYAPGWHATARSAPGPAGSPSGRRSSFALGMAGQVAYHLLAQAGMARAPWAITTIVSCLPVLVLAMGTALAHMLRADADATDTPDSRTGPPAVLRSLSWSSEDQGGPDRRRPEADRDRSARRDQNVPQRGPQDSPGISGYGPRLAQPQFERARMVARRLAAAGKPVSRRALRSGGVKGSNEALNALAHIINAERAGVPAAGETRDRRSP